MIGTVCVHVTRKAVKNFNLRVKPDNSVGLTIPWQASRQKAQEFLNAHQDWLEKALARAAQRQAANPDDGLVPLWGKLVRLPDGLTADELYRTEATRALPSVVKTCEAATGQHATAWQLRALTSRWGSCTPSTGRIRINVRLAAYPPTCLEYVVAHELTHLAEPSHNARFHALLSQAFPDEKDVRAILRQNPRTIAEDGRAPLP